MPLSTTPSALRAEVLTATPTLFDEHGDLDRDGNLALLTHLAARVDGVFVAGTTGEFPALERAERHWLAAAALSAFGPERVVVHVGAASTRDAVWLAQDAVALGAGRLAVLTPHYLPADAETILRHFGAVTAAVEQAAVYGYLFSERSGVAVEPSAFAGIAAAAGLAGAKLSGSAAQRFSQYRAALPAAVRLWTGADTTLAACARAGGAGVVSGLSAAFPEPFMALADALAADDRLAERAAQTRVDEVRSALGGTIEGIKLALRLAGLGSATMRMPHPSVSPAVQARIASLVSPIEA